MKNKTLYYITNFTPKHFNKTGSDKVPEQVNLFKNNGFSVCYLDVSKGISKLDYILSKIPFIDIDTDLSDMKKIKSNDNVYIRYFQSNIKLIFQLRKIRSKTKNVKIALEIPTYPYDKELVNFKYNQSIKNIPVYLKDKLTRKYLKKYVDRIVTFSNDDYIWGIRTIKISNGINMDKVKIRCPIEEKSNSINMIAVAKFGFWHGYDRMIKGLGEYYRSSSKKKREINFYIVGSGDIKVEKQYNYLIKKYNLENHVFLTGKKIGDELDKIYDKCDIAVDSMGRYRCNVKYNSTLKGKEYLAKGLPIISGVRTELDNMQQFKYYYRVPANDSSVNVNEVIQFYDSVYKGRKKSQIAKEIRDFCKDKFQLSDCFSKVIDWYKKGE